MGEYKYYRNCVGWPCNDVENLCKMVDESIETTRRTFLNHIDREDLKHLERALGYDNHYKQGLTMAGDWAVSYHRSKLRGKRVYYFRHSAIEYVFIKEV